MFGYIKKTWKDITQDKLGHTVAKDLFKAISFFTGLNMCIASCIASAYKIHIDTEPAVLLLLLSFGLQASKGVESYFQRKTADGIGNPLATPDSVPVGPVEVMPQGGPVIT